MHHLPVSTFLPEALPVPPSAMSAEMRRGFDLALRMVEGVGDAIAQRHLDAPDDDTRLIRRDVAIHGGQTTAAVARLLRLAV